MWAQGSTLSGFKILRANIVGNIVLNIVLNIVGNILPNILLNIVGNILWNIVGNIVEDILLNIVPRAPAVRGQSPQDPETAPSTRRPLDRPSCFGTGATCSAFDRAATQSVPPDSKPG